MLSVSLLVALFAAFLAGCVSGLTGFGFALISVPLFLFVDDPTTVVALTAVLSVAINVAMVWDSWKDTHKRLVLALLPPAFVGVMVGVAVLSFVDQAYVRLGVGVVVVFSTLLLLREVRLPGAGRRGNDERRALYLHRSRRPPDSAALRLARSPQAHLPGLERPLLPRDGLRGARRSSVVGSY